MILCITEIKSQSRNQFFSFRVKAVNERTCLRSNGICSFFLEDVKTFRASNIGIKLTPFFFVYRKIVFEIFMISSILINVF